MVIKRISVIALLLMSVCMCFSVSASAVTTNAFVDSGIAPAYEIAYNPYSDLSISGQTAYCSSVSDSTNAVKITVQQTLQKYSGLLWIWNDVDGAKWSSSVNRNSITVYNSKSGLSSGKYRLKSVFTLTSSNGETETITVYSEEKTV